MPRDDVTPVRGAPQIPNKDFHQLIGRYTAITPVVLTHAAITPLDNEALAKRARSLDVPLTIWRVAQDDVRLLVVDQALDDPGHIIRCSRIYDQALVRFKSHRGLLTQPLDRGPGKSRRGRGRTVTRPGQGALRVLY